MGQPQQISRYQASATVMLALLKMPAAWFQLSLLFLAPDIKFRCAQSFNKSSLLSNESLGEVWDESCWYRDGTGTTKRCEHWEYDRTELDDTVNMKWNLVCEKELLVTWVQFSFMSGVFFGNALGGLMANRVGRKPVLVVAVLCQPILSALVAIAPTFFLFLILRFFLGLALGGTIVMSFVLGGEQATGPWRPAISILHQVPFGIGQVILPLIAFFLRDWRELQMALSICSLIFLPYCWLIEESSQWLVATGRLKQAERVASAIQRRNKRPDAAVTEMCPMTTKNKTEIMKTDNRKINNNSVSGKEAFGFCGLFRTARLRRYVLSVWLMWYFAGLAFFTLNAYQTSLGGDPYVNVGVGGLLGGIPGNILTIFLVRRFGRKKIVIISLLLASLGAILIPIYEAGEAPWDWQRRVAALLTLIAMSLAYPSMFLASGEMIPAVVRAPVMGVANLMARLGNTTAPLIIPTSRFHRWAPMWVVCAAPFISALMMALLPETANMPLPVHIEDIEPTKWRTDEEVLKTEENGKIYKPVSTCDS